MDFIAVIPARFGSSRFPGKPLADIHGKPMIQHATERAREAGAGRVIVATDDDRIANVAAGFVDVCMTSPDHQSGTERIAQVLADQNIDDEQIVVNVQGDEPFVPPENIRQVAQALNDRQDIAMATLATQIQSVADVTNPNVVKVVLNKNNEALYFSRSSIPFERERMVAHPTDADPQHYHRHIGLYAYRARYVRQYVNYTPSVLEQLESLEQLRALWYGDKIYCALAAKAPPMGVDTPDDLAHLLAVMADR
ncbi:3-deoxy-manno-octulosonate cytidylyltransferase [Alteromonas halophila]|uniref:3-deoxy-manno-octulosonate cytidylyltransferase n=1 Tax=Alteromonas halophila TaxID=516698 RepID=A0A918MZY8_9ALTE|nr:3-deoxy-manno-octulosonate cytidylyltransferase [Alteromonas halophila]GGW87868.1 3-deoxy-manno-octulosonate cytidylyltransferase [Alteromonas halophila]